MVDKVIRKLINGYLLCNILVITLGVIDMWLMRMGFWSEGNSSGNILIILRLPAILVYMHYLLDLGGLNTAFLIVILILCIKDLKRTGEKRAFANTALLLAGSFMINMYAMYEMPF